MFAYPRRREARSEHGPKSFVRISVANGINIYDVKACIANRRRDEDTEQGKDTFKTVVGHRK